MSPKNSRLHVLTYILLKLFLSVTGQQTQLASIAVQYALTTSTSIPFPTATLSGSDSQSLINTQWGLSKGHIQDGASDLSFVDYPFPDSAPSGVSESNSTGPVLEVKYPAGSYDFKSAAGGAQFYNLWNTSDGSVFQSMLLSYDVAFDPGFDWVLGGKLPGLRGGPNVSGCDGGKLPNGSDCFTTRLMWRSDGAGEVYAYMETPNNLCSESNVICHSDFGVSLSRGAFKFASGVWQSVALLVQMNSPVNVANGNVKLYYNGLLAISQTNLQLRTSSKVDIGGLFFSTFFGGDTQSYATPNTTHSYFRNMMLWGGSSPSNLPGSTANAAARISQASYIVWAAVAAFLVLCLR